MNSKVSVATKSKTGGKKLGGGADSKIVSELQLNVKKLLEDVRKLNNLQHDTELALKKIDHILDDHRLKYDVIQNEQTEIKKKQEDIIAIHTNAMNDFKEKTIKVEKIYKDIQKMINDFKKEYRYGFKKIIK